MIGIVGAILLGVVIVVVLWAWATYNRLVYVHSLVEEGWSGIDVQLKRRYDLIPNLVETVKGYATHENKTLENITKYRSMSMQATTVADKATAEMGLTGALKSLFAVAENYPDLKANQGFLSLQKDLGSIEHELQLARRYYNGTVRNYNVLVQTLFSNIIAKFGNFTKASYFELNGQAEREAPKVQF